MNRTALLTAALVLAATVPAQAQQQHQGQEYQPEPPPQPYSEPQPRPQPQPQQPHLQRQPYGDETCPEGQEGPTGACVRRASPVCSEGMRATDRTHGYCCWPGQSWSDVMGRCEGPPNCEPGWATQGPGCVRSQQMPPKASLTTEQMQRAIRQERERRRASGYHLDDPATPPSTGAGFSASGGIFLGVGLLNLITAPLCKTSAVAPDIQSPCLAASLLVGGTFTLLGTPLAIVGAVKRAQYNAWRSAHPSLTSLTEGLRVTANRQYAGLVWRRPF